MTAQNGARARSQPLCGTDPLPSHALYRRRAGDRTDRHAGADPHDARRREKGRSVPFIAAQQQRIVATHDRDDFTLLHRAWTRWLVGWNIAVPILVFWFSRSHRVSPSVNPIRRSQRCFPVNPS